ncbi:ribonuclease HII [Candidatus Peregrinibacteria bacterium]|nr:ribonuclease HII [Candidatus Peregrinibacteria bacterium]
MKAHPLEIKLKKEGFLNVAGLDEAGRGPWAGPVVAAAVILPLNTRIPALNDSKQLTSVQREGVFPEIIKKGICGIGMASNTEIDEKGLAYANKLAFKRAVDNLRILPDYLLIDGIGKHNFFIPYKTIKFGDSRVRCIAAASIVAKVVRDTLMQSYDLMYPEFGFKMHKGYGTVLHMDRLKKYGLCPLHRQSFRPIKELINGSR